VYSITEKLRFIESVFGKGCLATDNKNFAVRCPICDHNDKSKRKLAIHVDDDKVHCWVCGFKAYTLAPLIKKFGSINQFTTYRDRFMPKSVRLTSQFNVTDTTFQDEKLELPKDFRMLTLASKVDPDVRAAWKYIEQRRLTLHDAWYFKLGVSEDILWKRRIIIPSFDANGALNYYVGRTIDKNDHRQRYINPNKDRMSIIFNEINVDWSQRLTLCEGPFDSMKCGENVVPLLGSDLSENSKLFNTILLNNTSIAMALDGDMWFTKAVKNARKLQEYDVDVIHVDVREWGDPGNMTKQQFDDALKSAKTMTWNDNVLDKLVLASNVALGHRHRAV